MRTGEEGVGAVGAAAGAAWLFVPGDRVDRFAKAVAAGADQVILDLEDAVAEPAKDAARAGVAAALADGLGRGRRAWVRVNAAGTRWHDNDLAALAGLPGLAGVMVPKAESAAALTEVADRLGGRCPFVALVESAVGIANAQSIANCPAVVRLAFGSIDFALDIAAAHTREALLFARSTLVIASRVAGLLEPVDGVTTAVRDEALVTDDTRYAAALGLGGKLCIHPSQVPLVQAAFRPGDDEIAWATKVLGQVGPGSAAAAALGGHMVDRPVLERARRILTAAGIPEPGTPDLNLIGGEGD